MNKQIDSISAQLEGIDRTGMVSEAPYSFTQRHGDNKGCPVFIERYHQDEYIYIYLNFAKDGLIFRDSAMKEQYDGYISFLSGTLDQNAQNINFDSLSMDINAITAYPGVYVFVYDESVPFHMRTLVPSLIADPMNSNSFFIEDLDDGLKRLGVTYVFYKPSLNYSEYQGEVTSLNKEGIGDILIPSGENLNKAFVALGLGLILRENFSEAKDTLLSSYNTQVNAINSEFQSSTSSIMISISDLEDEIASYTSQINALLSTAQKFAVSYPYVLEPLSNYTIIQQGLQSKNRTIYNGYISQINSLTSLRSSSTTSLSSLNKQFASLSAVKDSELATLKATFDNSNLAIETKLSQANDALYAPRSFRVTVPLNSRNHEITKVVIYDHNKTLVNASQASVGNQIGMISSYRSKIGADGTFNSGENDTYLFGGVEHNLMANSSWTMNYGYSDFADDEDAVSYYSVNPVTGIRTMIDRAEYISQLNSVSVAANMMSTFFEIIITPPKVSVLSSGQPNYDFSSIHSTLNTPYLKRAIDNSKIFAKPSLAIDFGEVAGREKSLSKTTSLNQQLIQGTYRAVTSFRVSDEGVNSKYDLSWKDSSGKGFDLANSYSSIITVPNVISDSLCDKHSALEFHSEAIALRTKSFISEYSFNSGFSIFFVVKQNEELCSDETRIHALYPTRDVYKNQFIEIDWQDSLLDSSDVDLFEEKYSLNYLYSKSDLMYIDDHSKSILTLVDTKGVDKSSNHEISSPLSAVSAGQSPASGFSKANFFESDSYAIIEVEYNGANSFNWYKNGVLQHTTSASSGFYSDTKIRSLFLGGMKNDVELNSYYSLLSNIRKSLSYIRALKNGWDLAHSQIAQKITELESLKSGKTAEEVNQINAQIAVYESTLSKAKTEVEALMSAEKSKLLRYSNEASPSGFNGEITEVVIYSGVTSEDIRIRTEGYLAHKYCLTNLLESDHTYKFIPPYEEDYTPEDKVVVVAKDLATVTGDSGLNNYYVLTTTETGTGWSPSWIPAEVLANTPTTFIEKASWNRSENTLTLHRVGAADLTVNIDIFDTFETEIFPITGELVPHFSSYIDAIFPYPTSVSDEQFQLSPAQKDFYDILKFHSRSFPDLLWEKNATGDKEIGGLYNSNTVDNSNFSNNIDSRRRSSYIWSGVVNKVGGSSATIRGSKDYYTSGYSVKNTFTPSASPIMVETSMDFNNGSRSLFLETLNMDCLFTVSREWTDADFGSNVENFDAVGVRLVAGNGSLYNLAFLISNENANDGNYSSLIKSNFNGAEIIKGFNPLEVSSISIDISNGNSQFIEILPGEQYSLEFVVYLGVDGVAKLDSTNRPIQSGWFVSNVSFVASDEQI